MKTLSVINLRKFAYFDYTSEKNQTPFQLGVIVIKESNNEIGVILQTYANGEFRTDMFGNSGDYECRLATIEEVKEFRHEIIEDIKVSATVTDLVKKINTSFARKKKLEKELLKRLNNGQPSNNIYSEIQELNTIINNSMNHLSYDPINSPSNSML